MGRWCIPVYRSELSKSAMDAAEVDAFYGELSAHMGISGCSDDLDRFFGDATGLMPPLRISSFYRTLLKNYSERKAWFHAHGIFVGHPRLAVLTEPLGNRSAYRYKWQLVLLLSCLPSLRFAYCSHAPCCKNFFLYKK